MSHIFEINGKQFEVALLVSVHKKDPADILFSLFVLPPYANNDEMGYSASKIVSMIVGEENIYSYHEAIVVYPFRKGIGALQQIHLAVFNVVTEDANNLGVNFIVDEDPGHLAYLEEDLARMAKLEYNSNESYLQVVDFETLILFSYKPEVAKLVLEKLYNREISLAWVKDQAEALKQKR